MQNNYDPKTVEGFGREWSFFDQSLDDVNDLVYFFELYFSLIDLRKLPTKATVLDVGCGSGRWAHFVSPYCETLHLVDPSKKALETAQKNLAHLDNCYFHNSTTQNMAIDDSSCDFVYSLGVLHHVPDTFAAVTDCVKKLKPGAPFLIYLYYKFDNRSLWFQFLWRVSDLGRKIICRLPFNLKKRTTDLIALTMYWPLSRVSRILAFFKFDTSSVPLSFYQDSSFYTMRTDALDRFGTRLEQRFTRDEIKNMLLKAGLIDIQFRESEPYWCAIGYRCVSV